MQQYIYQLRLRRPALLVNGPTAGESDVLDRHVAYLTGLAETGTVLLAGRTQVADSRAFGIVIFLADSEDDAGRIMSNDPAVENGLMNAELYPYRIAAISESINDAVAQEDAR